MCCLGGGVIPLRWFKGLQLALILWLDNGVTLMLYICMAMNGWVMKFTNGGKPPALF